MAIRTTTVTVKTPTTTVDRFGNEVATAWTSADVSGVLVSPGATADLEAARPDGVTVAYTVHFPKGFTTDLRGCLVTIGGEDYRVIGEPHPYMDVNTPTRWHMPVEVERADG